MSNYINTNNNKGDNKNDTNTRGHQLYSETGFDPSTILLNFWNNYCSIKIHPALPQDKRNETSKYDYDTSINMVFTAEKANALAYVLRKYVIPAIEEGITEDVSYAIPTRGGVNIIEVGNGIKIVNRIAPYIAIYRNVDTSTGVPEQEIGFEFLSEEIYKGYSTADGSKEVINRYNDLYLFLDYLESSSQALSKASAHASRDVVKYINSRILENQKQIMDKLGIETKYKNNNNNSSPRRMGAGGSSDNSSSGSIRNSIEEGELADLEADLEL